MGWSRSKKIILNKPYLIDPYREISLKEANKQWQKSGYPNKDSLLEKAAMLTENAEVRNKLLKYQTKKNESLSSEWHYMLTFRKATVAAFLIAVVLIVFMSFTTPGRALAEEIYKVAVKVVQNILYIRTSENDFPENRDPVLPDEAPQASNGEGESRPIDTADAAQRLNRSFLVLNDSNFTVTGLEIKQSMVLGLYFIEEYSCDAGLKLILYHNWPVDLDNLEVNVDIQNAVYQKHITKIGIEVEGILSEDNTYIGYSLWNNAILSITIKGGSIPLNWDVINELLDEISVFEP